MRKMKMIHRGHKGFTLIELLIVIAILAIVTSVIIPNISRFMTTGQLAAANSEAAQVKTASLGFRGAFGVWPGNSSALQTTGYITGALKADYTISTEYGWLLNATATVGGWSGISFAGAVDGVKGTHGRWMRT